MDEEHKALNRLAPRVNRDSLPHYYVSSDIPHVLAHVRLMRSFFASLEERTDLPRGTENELYRLYNSMVEDALAPYALELAESLIALEDSLEAPAEDPEIK